MNLYISDLDGTLLNSSSEISPASIDIINKLMDNGINFTIATARSFASTEKIISGLRLKLPMILRNGAYVYDPVKKENIFANYIDDYYAKSLIEKLEELGFSPLVLCEKNDQSKIFYKYLDQNNESLFIKDKLYANDKRLNFIDDYYESCTNSRISTVIILNRSNDILNALYEKLKNIFQLEFLFYEDVYSEYYILEILSQNANKKEAAKFLKKHLNADKVVCFGDNRNDYSMFEYADEKYAVANSISELKEISTGIIKSNDEDGVALFLKKRYMDKIVN